jgi:hypothetical protein
VSDRRLLVAVDKARAAGRGDAAWLVFASPLYKPVLRSRVFQLAHTPEAAPALRSSGARLPLLSVSMERYEWVLGGFHSLYPCFFPPLFFLF